jgi:Asp-tRNA(Asn)/Glu-tRNA(Gln) amidotransferase A subunit family amidase
VGQMYTSQMAWLIVDDPEIYHHGPVGVQVVGRRLREEQILEIAENVSNALPKL